MCFKAGKKCIGRSSHVNHALAVMKKIHADLTSKINVGRSCALSTKKLWLSAPIDCVSLPEHTERTECTTLLFLIGALDCISTCDLIVSVSLNFQCVQTAPNAKVRRLFPFVQRDIETGVNSIGGCGANRTAQAASRD